MRNNYLRSGCKNNLQKYHNYFPSTGFHTKWHSQTCVSPRVKSALPCALGSNPQPEFIKRIPDGVRPSLRFPPCSGHIYKVSGRSSIIITGLKCIKHYNHTTYLKTLYAIETFHIDGLKTKVSKFLIHSSLRGDH